MIFENLSPTIKKLRAQIAQKDSLVQKKDELILVLRKENNVLKERCKTLEQQQGSKMTMQEIISRIFKNKIEWFDYNELSKTELEKYYLSAQRILREPVFLNELNFLKSNWGKQALLGAHDQNEEQVIRHVRSMSWMVAGIELFKTRLEQIHDTASVVEKPIDPFKAI